MTPPPSRYLALFATEDELIAQRDFCVEHGCTADFVALTINADRAAEKHGVECHAIEDVFTQEMAEQCCADNVERIAELCSALNAVVCSQGGDQHAASAPDLAGEYYYYYFRLLMDQLAYAGGALDHMIRHYVPEAILYSAESDYSTDGMTIQPNNFLKEALPIVAGDMGVSVVDVAVSSIPSRKRNVGGAGGLKQDIKGCARQAAKRLDVWLSGLKAKTAVTVVADSHWTHETSKRLRDLGIDVRPVPRLSFNASRAVAEKDKSIAKQACGGMFRMSGHDLYPLVEQRLAYFVGDFLEQTRANVHAAKAFLAEVNAGGYVCTALVSPQSVTMAVASKQMGIPVIVMQHGGGNGYYETPICRAYDLYFADAYFAYGEMVAEFFKADYAWPFKTWFAAAPDMYVVGREDLYSLRAARGLVREDRSRRLRILFATSNFYDFYRFFDRQCSPDVLRWRAQKRVLKVIETLGGVDVTVKLPPHETMPSPLGAWARDMGLKSFVFDSGETLVAHLNKANYDLLITDGTATTLLQFLATDRPVITWMDSRYMDFDPEAMEILGKRAQVASDENSFVSLVEAFVASFGHDASERDTPLDDDFLNGYGQPGTDMAFADCLAAALLDAAKPRHTNCLEQNNARFMQ